MCLTLHFVTVFQINYVYELDILYFKTNLQDHLLENKHKYNEQHTVHKHKIQAE